MINGNPAGPVPGGHARRRLAGALLAMLVAACLLLPVGQALAYTSDTAGNAYSSESSIGGESIASDLVWAGADLSLDAVSVGGDVLAMGASVRSSGSTVGGDVRVLGSTVSINSTEISGNATILGQDVMIGQGTSSNGAFLMGGSAGFYGTSNALTMTGTTVVIDGVVNGDASVTAQNVTIGPGTVISGKLTVSSGNEPVIQDGAQLGDYEFKPDSTLVGISSASPLVGSLIGITGAMVAVTTVVMLAVTALIMTLLMRREIGLAATMTREHPIRMLVVGLITVFLLPIALIVLVMLVATMWAALCAMVLVAFLTLIALPFAGSALGRLAFRSMNPFLSAVIGTAVVSLLAMLPYIGLPVMMVCSIYTAGYFACSAGQRIRDNVSGDGGEGQGRQS